MKTLLFTGLAAATAMTASASAGLEPGDVITVSRLGTAPGHAIRYNYDASRAWDATATGADYFGMAGVNSFATESGGILRTFCVEMNEGFVDDPIVYTVTELANVPEELPSPGMSEVRQTLMKDLYARFYDDTQYEPGMSSWSEVSNSASAFQLIVWEISHENFGSETDASLAQTEMDISVGAMSITDSYSAEVASIAAAMISDLGNGGFLNYTKLLGLTNPNNQDMLIVVPSPAIAALAGLGLVGMRRRRR
jgi:hypothetical protein